MTSKNNTPLPHYLSAPRPFISSTPLRQPPARESLLPFGSCQLCLQPARNPVVACATNGDLFCRECAVRDLLAQRQEIHRVERERVAARRKAAARETRLLREAKEKEVVRFEKMSSSPGNEEKEQYDKDGSLNKNGKRRASLPAVTREEYYNYSSNRSGGNGNEGGDVKRRKRRVTIGSSGDEDIGDEKNIDNKPPLPSFWVPSLTPSVDVDLLTSEPSKTAPICPGSTETHRHGYSLKTLVDVHFTEEAPPEEGETGGGLQQPQRICPSCKKVLTNGLKAISKPCGHVICLPCVSKFMMPQGNNKEHGRSEAVRVRCYVCEADVTPSSARRRRSSAGNGKDKIMPGLIELRSDGRRESTTG